MIQITGLTPYQVEMLDHMWSLESLEEYETWYCLLDDQDQKMADSLQRMILQELMERELENTHYKEARQVLKKFVLQ